MMLGNKDHWKYALIVVLFFASGLSSLIYQVVWTRMLVLVFGSTTYATATVLAIFMGGLALGAWLAGRVADRLSNQFLWYGILEAIIGVWALLAPMLFTAAEHLYQLVYPSCHNQIAIFTLIRFVLAAIILLPPTTCMGASLPLLAKYVTASLDEVGSRIGTLYSVNTFGAIVGAGTAGFILLPAYGLHMTTLIAAAVNFVLFLIVLPASSAKFSWNTLSTLFSGVQDATATEAAALPTKCKVAIACFAASGAIAMIYEVCWTRALLLMVGSSTYAFTIMLCSFLIGIFLGSLIFSKLIDRIKQPLILFSLLQFGVAALAAASMSEFMFLPFANVHLYRLSFDDASWYLVTKAILCGALLLPFTFCLGATFPAVVKGCTQELTQVGRSTGNIYAANTIGAIVGAFLAGFLLIPAAGVEKTLVGAVSASGAVAALSLWNCGCPNNAIRVIACAAMAVCIGWWLCLPPLWDPVIVAFAQVNRRFSDSSTPQNYQTWQKALHQRIKLPFYKDGASSSVAVLDYSTTKEISRSLVTNGHIDGSDADDKTTQSLVSAFPLLLRPTADDVAVIGWGVGMSAGTAGLFPVKSIDVIELEPAVVQASKFFHHINYSAETNPKIHIQYNDGRNYLLATNKYYDVIVSEPSNPWQSGVCNLFTTEYFHACRNRLKPNGIFSLWMQLLEVSPDDVRRILKSLKECFPHAVVMQLNSNNIAVMASTSPVIFDLRKLREVVNLKSVGPELSHYDLDSAEAVLSRLYVSDAGVDNLVRGAAANTDDRNALEFSVGRSYETKTFDRQNASLLKSSNSSPWQQIEAGNASASELANEALLIAEAAVKTNFTIASQWLTRSTHLHPTIESVALAAELQLPTATFDDAEHTCNEWLQTNPADMDALKLRGMIRLFERRRAEAQADFAAVIRKQPDDKMARYYMGYSYCGGAAGLTNFAPLVVRGTQAPPNSATLMLKYLEPLVTDGNFVAQHPTVLLWTADAYYRLGRNEKAMTLLNQYKDTANVSIAGCRLIGNVYSNAGLRIEGSAWLERSFQLAESRAADLLRKLPDQASTEERLDTYAAVLEIDPLNACVVQALSSMQEPRAKDLLKKVHSGTREQ
jgi:spermidine synthase